ncbi:DUF1565 domain-containing protein [Sorangium atrum]|uniref:DUF1565 domain-containing protein n=1 Tax=Sorangium atrum TaxID=2995308 RepID=A0ABT5CFV6_9BACT|nr:DUF1565 domain-containing protein [Sorangium aterium]MDC0685320.1 DUF1565 domain-containing protein [Sorangium aterium]
MLRAKLGHSALWCLFSLASSLCAVSLFGCESTNLPPYTSLPGEGAGGSGCAPGQISGASGCAQVGIPGCVDAFVDEDGFCRPTLAKCSPGTIPKHDEGCIEVGIPGCAAEFVEGGACHPTMAKCPEGTFAVPQKGCVSIDGPDGCGSMPWGEIVEAPGDLHVDPAYEGGDGDGSRERPFTTLAEALASVRADGRVVLAEGEYDEPIEITKPIEIVGRCASRVVLRGEQSDPSGNVSAVWIHDVERAGVSGVSVLSASIGMLIQAAAVSVRDIRVTGESGNGLVVALPGARLDLSRSLIQSSWADDGAGEVWTSVLVVSGAEARLTENALVGGTVNLRISSEAAEVVAEGNLLEAAGLRSVTSDGVGVHLEEGTLRLDANALVDHRLGALVTGAGAELVAARNLIAAPADAAPEAGGLAVEHGARASLASSVLSGACDALLVVADADTAVEASGNLFDGAAASESDRLGVAVEQRGGALSLSSSLVRQAGDAGLFVSGGTLSASGVVIEGTRASPLHRDRAAGVLVQGGRAALASAYVLEPHVAGVSASQGATLEIADSLIERSLPEERDGTGGVGLLSAGAAQVLVQRSAVLESRVAGLLLASPSTVEDTAILGVEGGTFSALSAGGQTESVPDLGDGLVVLGSTAQVSYVQVHRCARAGLLFSDSRGALVSSESTGNRFGLVVQGAQAPSVSEDNSFEGNQESDQLAGGTLPVPSSAAPAP